MDRNDKHLRTTFQERLELWPAYYFDFVYIDGYAGNGFVGGQILRNWSKKIKIDSVIVDYDYDAEMCSLTTNMLLVCSMELLQTNNY